MIYYCTWLSYFAVSSSLAWTAATKVILYKLHSELFFLRTLLTLELWWTPALYRKLCHSPIQFFVMPRVSQLTNSNYDCYCFWLPSKGIFFTIDSRLHPGNKHRLGALHGRHSLYNKHYLDDAVSYFLRR